MPLNLEDSELICIAKLGRPVGLAGFIKIYLETDFPEQFIPGSSFYLINQTKIIVESFNDKKQIVKFFNSSSRDSVSQYTNQILYTTKELTQKNCFLKPGQFFWFELIGFSVYCDQILLGKVSEINRFNNIDYFYIETDQYFVKEFKYSKYFFLPYIDKYVINIDSYKKTIFTIDSRSILEKS